MNRKIVYLMAVLLLSVVVMAVPHVPGTLAFMVDSSDQLVNTFVPEESLLEEIQVPITVQKIVTCTGTQTIGPEDFTFVLTNTENGETQTALSGWNGQAKFALTFTAMDEGTYTYTLTEQNNGRTGITYSDLVYTIEIVVAGTPAEATVSVNGEVTDNCTVTFENIYDGGELPPDTGDDMNLALYVLLMLFSGAGLMVMKKKGCKC